MKFLIIVPNESYYLWQMIVQINNFRKLGIEQDTYYLIGVRKGQSTSLLYTITGSKELKSHFYIRKDNRINVRYKASLKPYLVKHFLADNPEMQKEIFFYTDPDVIFTKKIDFKQFEKDDIWYLSDASSYLNSKYIKSKGEQLFIEMCEIVGIDPLLVEQNDDNAGGAQWIIKNNTVAMWDLIEMRSNQLFDYMKATETKYHPKSEEYPIQSWTSEMWAMLWIPWLMGIKTKIHPDLDFSMATDKSDRLEEVSILHNTGVVTGKDGHFWKVAYQISPFKQDIPCSKESASYRYVEEIKDTEKNFPNIIF